MLNNQDNQLINISTSIKNDMVKYSDQVELFVYKQHRIGVSINKNNLYHFNDCSDGISLRLIKGKKEYNSYHSTFNNKSIVEQINHNGLCIPIMHSKEFISNKKHIINSINSEKSPKEYKDIIEDKTEQMRKSILEIDPSIKITDFQFIYNNKEVCINNTSNSLSYINSPEFALEIEIQKVCNNETVLGSSYIYKRAIDDIKVEDVLNDITFPLKCTEFIHFDKNEKYENFIFGHPMIASILENISYYDLVNKPISNKYSSINIYDDPFNERSINYYPFDDYGNTNKKTLLYGNNDNIITPINSYYKINEKNINRSISSKYNLHPTNIVIEGKTQPVSELFSSIDKGVYCHLIVGNHNCNSDYIEGTVFNGFKIVGGKIVNAFYPFGIKINKRDFLEKISSIGDNYREVRPFPWWTPIVVITPNIITNNLKIY